LKSLTKIYIFTHQKQFSDFSYQTLYVAHSLGLRQEPIHFSPLSLSAGVSHSYVPSSLIGPYYFRLPVVHLPFPYWVQIDNVFINLLYYADMFESSPAN